MKPTPLEAALSGALWALLQLTPSDDVELRSATYCPDDVASDSAKVVREVIQPLVSFAEKIGLDIGHHRETIPEAYTWDDYGADLIIAMTGAGDCFDHEQIRPFARLMDAIAPVVSLDAFETNGVVMIDSNHDGAMVRDYMRRQLSSMVAA